MKTLFKCLFIALAAISVTSCNGPETGNERRKATSDAKSEVSGKITISGAYALSNLVNLWAEEFTKRNPGAVITINPGSTGQGINDLLAGKAELAMISRPLTLVEEEAGIWVVPVAKDGVAPIINKDNPFIDKLLKCGLSPDEFKSAFSGADGLTWGKLLDTVISIKPVVFIRDDQSGASEILSRFLQMGTGELRGTVKGSDQEIISSVASEKFSIGFCNFSYAFDPETGMKTPGVQVLPVDMDNDNTINRKEVPFADLNSAHRGMWLGIYPEALCRELTIGMMGKPGDELTKEFLRFILTDGQQMVKGLGLCELNVIYTRFALESLDN